MASDDVTFHDVISELGLRKGKNKGDITEYYCPVHDGDTADLCMYTGDFYCFSDPKRNSGGYEPKSLLMHVKQMNNRDVAEQWMNEHFPEKNVNSMDQEAIEKENGCERFLTKPRR